jgi:hypothetical protein
VLLISISPSISASFPTSRLHAVHLARFFFAFRVISTCPPLLGISTGLHLYARKPCAPRILSHIRGCSHSPLSCASTSFPRASRIRVCAFAHVSNNVAIASDLQFPFVYARDPVSLFVINLFATHALAVVQCFMPSLTRLFFAPLDTHNVLSFSLRLCSHAVWP